MPLFLAPESPLQSTAPTLDKPFWDMVRSGITSHLEIETYTWDVLPEHLKSADITEYVVRELQYVRARLLSRTEV